MKKEKLSWAERRRRWKEAKAEKKRQEKEYYRYAPFLVKAWHYWLRTVTIIVALLAVVCLVFGQEILTTLLMSYVDYTRQEPITDEERAQSPLLSPLDDEGAKRIDALPAVGEKETWTICVYMVGADLEDDGENDLSYVTSILTREARDETAQNKRVEQFDRLKRFNKELDQNGLELPAFYYNPNKPVASSSTSTEEQGTRIATREGFASSDIGEMTSDVWSDNIKIVFQTGGATRWSNQMVNPNRTQRFLYAGGELEEVSNLPMQNATDPATLSEFLRFCDKEYPSDHRMLILWNHGGGPFGYGMDSVYGGGFSLKQIREAFTNVYGENVKKAPFDIIGFDACLMSTLEVTKSLSGFANYYCLSEESEPGDGWDYAPLLQTMTDNPTMSPAKVAQTVADTYTDYYMAKNAKYNASLLGQWLSQDVTFSVIDAKKADQLYDAYSELTQAQLKDAVSDISVLSEIGRCGSKSTRYGGAYYNVFNTVDLGNYASFMVDSYPDQCSKISKLVREAVLYHRQNGALGDSTGIAVYIPTKVNDISGLLYYLDYVYNISDEPSITALYYYKQAGCLNEELKQYVSEFTKKEPKVLDVSRLKAFSKSKPVIDSEGFVVPVDEQQQSMITDYQLEIGLLDEEKQTITYYGRDERLYLDGNGHLCSDFQGDWICLDGNPLAVELVSSSPSALLYRSNVKYDGEDSWLEFRCDRDSGDITITGVRTHDEDESDANYFVNAKNSQEVESGKTIIPIYEEVNLDTNEVQKREGDSITFGSRTKIERKALPNGYYLCTDVISDQRGDVYYSPVVAATVQGGAVTNWELDSRFVGSAY